jgi:hypothetical protein
VTRSAPPYTVLYGNPAVVVRHFDRVKAVWRPGPPSRKQACEGDRDR